MDAAAILHELTHAEGLQKEALRAASERRAEMTPLFLDEIEKYLAASSEERGAPSPLFFIFHLLGEWREKSAYRPLARLLRSPRNDIDHLLGDAITTSVHRVMAAVFDGDPQPLFDIVLEPEADEFVRSTICDTLTMLVVLRELPREQVAAFLAEAFDKFPKDDEECFVWSGWMEAIAALGLEELTPLVESAFERGYIDPTWTELKYFQKDLAYAIANPEEPFTSRSEMTLWGDTIEEFSTWYGFSDEYKEDRERAQRDWAAKARRADTSAPYVNEFRHVGRNDPCPCGSGKKYKKCCLAA